jgi:nucleotide-binding universal stress UspA family protein
MIKKLLLAYDGSEPAKLAFEFAWDMARRYQSEFHVVAVVHPPEYGMEGETEAVIERSLLHFRGLLDGLKAQMGNDLTTPVVFETLVGHPAEQIVLYAERKEIDHIVVGHRGSSLFERWLVGSVARRVIAYAHCAVTVVRT